MRKLVIICLAVVSTTLALTSAADARPWRRSHGWAGPAAVGVVGALALGAMAASAAAAPAPVYGCRRAREPVFNRWGHQIGWRRVQVCD